MGNPAFDYDSLIKPLEPRMMRTIWRILREKPAAEDALQDALAVIWKKRGTVARHPNPPALILRITIASAVDSLRKTRRRLRHEVPGLPKDRRADDSADRAAGKAEERRFRPAILQGRRPPSRKVLLRFIRNFPTRISPGHVLHRGNGPRPRHAGESRPGPAAGPFPSGSGPSTRAEGIRQERLS